MVGNGTILQVILNSRRIEKGNGKNADDEKEKKTTEQRRRRRSSSEQQKK